jgi:hypothetical protein
MNIEQSIISFSTEAYVAATNAILSVLDKNFTEIEARLSKLEKLNTQS